jgi:uncharacterized repeat protein (TIGR04042 family)
MPEMRFRIRWPDGSSETCNSPSLVIKDYFSVGTAYPLADFLERSRVSLAIASERVKGKYGMSCRRAMAQLARIEAAAEAFANLPDPRVAVDGFDE